MQKSDVINKAVELGFEDIDFTNIEPFDLQKEVFRERKEEYALFFFFFFNLHI